MNEVKELIGLSNKNIKVTDVKEVIKNKQIIKEITIVGNVKKVKCPVCNKYTSSIHDYLKPMSIKYNKMACYDCNLILIKRRFICHRCNKKNSRRFRNKWLQEEYIKWFRNQNKKRLIKILFVN